jgi:hypothetical protein
MVLGITSNDTCASEIGGFEYVYPAGNITL